jgi:GxxExxY protein
VARIKPVKQRIIVEGYKPLSERENFLGKQITNISFMIHDCLGPGLLESVYTKCFVYELEKRGIHYLTQQAVPIIYDKNLIVENGLRLDLLVDDSIIVEIKAQENYHPIWNAQILSYLKLTGKRLGYLINFHTTLMKDGITRLIC